MEICIGIYLVYRLCITWSVSVSVFAHAAQIRNIWHAFGYSTSLTQQVSTHNSSF